MTIVHGLPKFIDLNYNLLFIKVFISTIGSITILYRKTLRNDKKLSLVYIEEVEKIPLPTIHEIPHLLCTRSHLKHMILGLLYPLFNPYPINYINHLHNTSVKNNKGLFINNLLMICDESNLILNNLGMFYLDDGE